MKLNIGQVEVKDFEVNIKIGPDSVTPAAISLLYSFLNKFDDHFFITIYGLPYCVMPDALEHIMYEKYDHVTYYYDSTCNKCEFNDVCPGWQDNINLQRKDIPAISLRPVEVVIELTHRCNMACLTCSVDKAGHPDVTFRAIKKILKDSKDTGVNSIRFTGGEPLLHKDIKKALLYAKTNGFNVILNTNASMIGASDWPVLTKTVANVLVSLQGYNKGSEDFLTNSDIDFKAKVTNILRLKKIIPLVRIGTVISRTLIENFDSYAHLLKKIGIGHWELYRPINIAQDKEFNISKQDIVKVMGFLLQLKSSGIIAKIANPVPFCITRDRGLALATLLGARVDDGHSRMVFDPRGFFKPSYFIDKDLGVSISQAWRSPFLKKIRSLDYLPKKCKKCCLLRWCKGGSRAIAKRSNNDYFSVDPLAQGID